MAPAQNRDEFQPVVLRHQHVGDHQVKGLQGQAFPALAAVAGDGDPVAALFQHQGDQLAERRLVIDEQNGARGGRGRHDAMPAGRPGARKPKVCHRPGRASVARASRP